MFLVAMMAMASPMIVEAKVVQKKVVRKSALTSPAPADPKKAPSKCLGNGIRAIYNAAVKQMEKDIAKDGTGNDEAVKRYRGNLQLVWEAMNEPYCGYGSRGVSAVTKSFNKTINRTRTEFLKATKVKINTTKKQ